MMFYIPLSPEDEAKLRAKAKAVGTDAASYAAQLLHDAVTASSLDEMLAPFRPQVEESGMSDPQIDEFYDELRKKVGQHGVNVAAWNRFLAGMRGWAATLPRGHKMNDDRGSIHEGRGV